MFRKTINIIMCMSLLGGVSLPAFAEKAPAVQQQAQSRTVKGTVVDEDGEPIIGATIMVAGKNNGKGVISDIEGNFTITVPAGAKLKVSYIGYLPQTISKFPANLRVVLEEDANSLDDVVVVGYGALKQKNVTGSVEVIDAKELKDLSVTSLSEALIGLSPSLHVTLPSTGRPGENATITIRNARDAVALVPTGTDAGGNMIGGSANSAPLYVIDDFISTEDDFNELDIDEVESLSILKDGEAAIYGAYGAYGVILVKTKRGTQGTPKISYQLQMSYVDAMKEAKMLDAYNYGLLYNAAKYSLTSSTSRENDDPLLDYFQYDELQAMKNMDYNLLDKYWSGSLSQRHSININGGTQKATYYAGVSYQTQDGNIGKLDYDRWNYRAGVTANIGKYFKASLTLSGDNSTKDMHMSSAGGGNNEDYVYMLKNPPYVPDEVNGYPIYNPGMKNDPNKGSLYNYSSLYKSRNNQKQQGNSMSLQGSIDHDFSWFAPLKGLHLHVTYSKNVSNDLDNSLRMSNTVYRVKNRGGSGQHLYITDPNAIIDRIPDDPEFEYTYYDEETLEGFKYIAFENLETRVLNQGQSSYLKRSMKRSDSYQLNFALNYNRKFGEHTVGGNFIIERGENWSENLTGTGTHPLTFTDGQSGSLNNDGIRESEWSRSEAANLSYVGRVNYAYKDRYLFQYLARAQASAAKFSPENYWGLFHSASAGWVISEEPWFNKAKMGLDFLKFRASFAYMGHDNVEAWKWKQLYNMGTYDGPIFGTNTTLHSGYYFGLPEKSGTNPDLKWDDEYKMNFGIDARAFDSRLSVTFDAYYDMGRNMFDYPQGSTLPGTVGIYPAPENYAQMDSWGVEATFGWRQRINSDMYLSARLGTGYDDNKVLRRFTASDTSFGGIRIGERTDRGTWGMSCIGMFRSYQEIEEYFAKYNITSYLNMTKDQVQPGMLIYEDIRGPRDENGEWTAPDGKISSSEDLVEISHRASNPYHMNLSLNFVWKDLSVQATATAEWGSYTFVPGSLKGESFGGMETTNINAWWKDMFVYEDHLDENGNYLSYANRDGWLPNIRYSSVNAINSTFWKMSAAKIYLHNITLAYTLPKKLIRHTGLSSARLNVTCQNALNFYNPIPKKAWDNFAGSYGGYPTVRKITLGLNVSF